MHLIDDEHLVAPHLRQDIDLLDQGADIFRTIVRGRIKLVDVQTSASLKRMATFAFPASLPAGAGMQAVDRLGKNTSASRLTYAARSAE